MTPEDREKAIQAVERKLRAWWEIGITPERFPPLAFEIVEALAALGSRGPVTPESGFAALAAEPKPDELPALDPDEQAKHTQAMRELAALAFDPNSLDRSQVDRSQDSASPWSRATKERGA